MGIKIIRLITYNLSILALSCLVTLSAPAEVYKWVDDEGNVHYGEKPPNTPTDRAVENIKIKDDVSTSDNQRANETFKEKSKSLDENRKKRKKEKLQKKKKESHQANMKKACKLAKKILAGYQMPRVALKDGDEYTWLDEEQKQVKIKAAKADVKKFCK